MICLFAMPEISIKLLKYFLNLSIEIHIFMVQILKKSLFFIGTDFIITRDILNGHGERVNRWKWIWKLNFYILIYIWNMLLNISTNFKVFYSICWLTYFSFKFRSPWFVILQVVKKRRFIHRSKLVSCLRSLIQGDGNRDIERWSTRQFWIYIFVNWKCCKILLNIHFISFIC